MEIRIRETGQVMFWNEFRELLLSQNPSELITVAPQTEEWLDAHGADVVLEGPQATPTDQYGFSYRNGVEQIEGKWYTKYSVGPVFQDDAEGTAADKMAAYKAMKDAEHAKAVRDQRNDKLKDCDWTQLADSPVNKATWATYRQALRDLTKQSGFPWTIDWPVAP